MTFHVAFVNVPGHPVEVLTVSPPEGILSMAAVASGAGWDVHFLDADVDRLGPRACARRLESWRPDLIGLTLNVSQVSPGPAYVSAIKDALPGVPLVAGGPYVTSRGAAIFEDFPQIEFAVAGEGEYALLDLGEHVAGRRPAREVRNLLFRSGEAIRSNPVERIEELDELPMPDYSIVAGSLRAYPGAFPSAAAPTVAILCARGCPFECSFCSSPGTWGRKVTYRSPGRIVEELAHLDEDHGVKEVFFQDDTMNARSRWFVDLCERIVSAGLHERMTFKAPFKANAKMVDSELLDAARRANFWMIYFGVENGNPEMLKGMKKRISLEEIERAFRLTHAAGLCTYASFMVGNPGETRETVEDSLALASRLSPDFGGFAVAAPFPGSELHAKALARGHVSRTDFRKYRFGECILRTDALSYEEITNLAGVANRGLEEICERAPAGPGADRRTRHRAIIRKRYGVAGTVARFGIRGMLRRYGIAGLAGRGFRALGRKILGRPR